MSGTGMRTSLRRERDQWLAIELRHLAALATVARESSFSGAAESLGYVQSAISQQIAYLERIVGRRLVERSGRPRSVTLTDAGAVLLDHAEQILEQLRLAKLDIDAIADRANRAISFGMAALFGTWLPARFLAEVLPEAGGEGWGRVARGPSSQLLDAVAAGRLDAAFVELPIASGPFFAIELLRDPCVLAVPVGSGAHARSAEAALAHWSLVSIDDCRATEALLARGVHSLHGAESPASALPFVRSGAAVAAVSVRDVPEGDRGVATLPLADVPPRVLGLAWHRDRDDCPAIAALRDAARRAFPPSR
jgi:DNA-binding transcriptional LysR family regulator